MSRLLRGAAALLLLGLAGAGWVAWKLGDRPDLSVYDAYLLPQAGPAGPGRRVSVAFLGVATLLFSDGHTHLMTDGFFTRVSYLDGLRNRAVAPDRDAVARALARAGVTRLAAVMAVHSHYDHAMDAPEVARRTGALLLGSRTTAWIGRGDGLPEEQIRVVEPGVPIRLGDFTVTFHESRHVPLPFGLGRLDEELDAPLVPPVGVSDYPMGGAFTIEIAHPLGTTLVQGSANFLEGALQGVQAHTVLLGTGALGRRDPTYREAYYQALLDGVGAHRVIPIHFDDLTAPWDGPLVPGPALVDDVTLTFDELIARAEANPELEFALLPWWQPTILFEE